MTFLDKVVVCGVVMMIICTIAIVRVFSKSNSNWLTACCAAIASLAVLATSHGLIWMCGVYGPLPAIITTIGFWLEGFLFSSTMCLLSGFADRKPWAGFSWWRHQSRTKLKRTIPR